MARPYGPSNPLLAEVVTESAAGERHVEFRVDHGVLGRERFWKSARRYARNVPGANATSRVARHTADRTVVTTLKNCRHCLGAAG